VAVRGPARQPGARRRTPELRLAAVLGRAPLPLARALTLHRCSTI
jgi:hypothetical protein